MCIRDRKAGDGSGLALPPAFVVVNPRQHRRYKKGNQDQVDGRTSGAKELMSRFNRRKMKGELNLPHSRMHKRNFVLFPLFEIDKNWKHPVSKHSIKKLLLSLKNRDIRSIKQI